MAIVLVLTEIVYKMNANHKFKWEEYNGFSESKWEEFNNFSKLVKTGNTAIEEFIESRQGLEKKYGLVEIWLANGDVSLRYLIYGPNSTVDVLLLLNMRGEIAEVHSMPLDPLPIDALPLNIR